MIRQNNLSEKFSLLIIQINSRYYQEQLTQIEIELFI